MAATRIVESLRAKYASNKKSNGDDEELMSEVEALRTAVEIYEKKIVELEQSNLNYARTQLQLQAVSNLLVVEQKRTHALQCTVSAYQVAVGGDDLDIDPYHPEKNVQDTGEEQEAAQAKAAAELNALMAQFEDDEDEAPIVVSQNGKSTLSAEKKSSSPDRQVNESMADANNTNRAPPAVHPSPNTDQERKLAKLNDTVGKMKVTIASLHGEKTKLIEDSSKVKGELQKVQMTFQKCKQVLEEERAKARKAEKDNQARIAEQKQRVFETEHRGKIQLQRHEEKSSKEIAQLTRQRDSLQREVDRLTHYEERHHEMETEAREAVAELKRTQRACEEAIQTTESRFDTIRYYAKKKFAEFSDVICDALPDKHDLRRIPLPPPANNVMSLKQLGEVELVKEMEMATSMINYIAKLAQPSLRRHGLVNQFERRKNHDKRVEELKHSIQLLLLGFENDLEVPPVQKVLPVMEEVVGEDTYLEAVAQAGREDAKYESAAVCNPDEVAALSHQQSPRMQASNASSTEDDEEEEFTDEEEVEDDEDDDEFEEQEAGEPATQHITSITPQRQVKAQSSDNQKSGNLDGAKELSTESSPTQVISKQRDEQLTRKKFSDKPEVATPQSDVPPQQQHPTAIATSETHQEVSRVQPERAVEEREEGDEKPVKAVESDGAEREQEESTNTVVHETTVPKRVKKRRPNGEPRPKRKKGTVEINPPLVPEFTGTKASNEPTTNQGSTHKGSSFLEEEQEADEVEDQGIGSLAHQNRMREHQKALGLLNESHARSDGYFDEEEAKLMKEQEENLQRGKEALEAARNVMNIRLPKAKKLKPLDKLKLDPHSTFGQPRTLRPEKKGPKGRVGGPAPGKLVKAQIAKAFKREGPPPKSETPDLKLGSGEPRKSFQEALDQP